MIIITTKSFAMSGDHFKIEQQKGLKGEFVFKLYIQQIDSWESVLLEDLQVVCTDQFILASELFSHLKFYKAHFSKMFPVREWNEEGQPVKIKYWRLE